MASFTAPPRDLLPGLALPGTCEQHVEKGQNQSLFTGLCSITHFGQPCLNPKPQQSLEQDAFCFQEGLLVMPPPKRVIKMLR